MSSVDPVLALFEGDKDYPGKRAPANRKVAKPEPKVKAEPSWDARPRTMLLKGVEREFFEIGALAMAVNRKPVTIRKWETEGVIPKANFRSPKPKGQQVPGKALKGKRLYSREQIQFIVDALARFGIDGPAPQWAAFKTHVAKHWPTK